MSTHKVVSAFPRLMARARYPRANGRVHCRVPFSTAPISPSLGSEVDKQSIRLRSMLERNSNFVASGNYKDHSPVPQAATSAPKTRAIIVTCMDTRLTTLLPAALGIRAGDAKVIKNAGAIISHPFGGIMRSVVVALYELNCDEVFVIGHYDCGMNSLNGAQTLKKMEARGGIPLETIKIMQYAGIDLQKWLHGFASVQDSVRTSVDIIRNHPLVPKGVPVHGLIIDPNTGKLDLVVDGTLPVQ